MKSGAVPDREIVNVKARNRVEHKHSTEVLLVFQRVRNGAMKECSIFYVISKNVLPDKLS